MPSPPRRSSRANKGVAPNRLGSWLTRAGSNPDLFAMSAESATASSGGSDSESTHDQTIVEQPEASSAGALSALSLADELEGAVGGLPRSRESARTVSPTRTSSSRSSSVDARSSSSRQELIADLHAQLHANMQERNELEQSRLQVELAFADYKRRHSVAMRGAAANAPATTTISAQSHVAVSSSHLQQHSLNAATTAHAPHHALTSTPNAASPSDHSPCVKPTGTIPKVFTHRAAPQPFEQVQFVPSTDSVHSSYPSVLTPTLQRANPSAHGILAARTTASMYTMRTTPALSYMHAGISSSSAQHSSRMALTASATRPHPPGGPQAHYGHLEAARAAPAAQLQDPGNRALPAATVSLSSRATSAAGLGVQSATSFAAQPPLQHVATAQDAHAAAIAPAFSAAGFAPSMGAFSAQVSNTFGVSSASAFGAPPTNAFGAQSFSAFGTQPSGAFGGPPSSAFSAPPLGAFGAHAPSAGVPSSSAFGVFGAAPSHHFGAVGAQALGAYGAPNPGAMGYGEVVLHPHRRLYELPPFSGRPEEWPMFVNTFVNTTAAYGYTQLENLTRLQKSVVGEAKLTIQCLLIHPQHVDAAMMRLQTLYGRPERLVRSQIQLARDLPSVTEERIVELVAFATAVQNVAMFLDTPATQFYLADPILLEELVRKLPMGRRISWAADAARLGRQATVMDFANWVTAIADLIGNVTYEADRSQQSRSAGKGGAKRHVLLNVESEASEEESIRCAICSGNHNIVRCDEFLELAVNDRWQAVFRRTLCIGCLAAGHLLPGCDKRKPCGEGGCTSGHHRLLHAKKDASAPRRFSQTTTGHNKQPSANGHRRERREHRGRDRRSATKASQSPPTPDASSARPSPSPSPPAERPAESAVVSTVNHCSEAVRKSVLLFRIVPVTAHGPKGQVSTFALLDEGSSITLVDAGLADELGLQGPSTELSLGWFSDHTSVMQSRRVSLDIAGLQDGCARYQLQNVRTIEKLKLPAQTVDAQSLLKSFPHLKTVPFLDYAEAKPRILIGLDHHHLGVPIEIRADAEQRGIVASKTPLGWIVYGSDGPMPLRRTPVLTILDVADADARYAQLHQLVSSHFSTESFGVKASDVVAESDDTKRAKQILQQTTRRVSDNRFEVGLLWRNINTRLPPSYSMALRRLHSVEARMRRDPAYRDQYNAQIEAYVSKGYARQLSDEEARSVGRRSWFLPHFAVFNANKPGKFRLVFDAAATVGGVSLNTELLTGPDVNVGLVRLLLQFRCGSVAVVGDIKEMYHQVRVRPDDQCAQMFLWRAGDASVEPTVYAMQVMTFGATCSPASAQHIKNVNAAEHADQYPAAAAAIQSKHYVDDYVASYDTVDEAISVTGDIVRVHRRGGFELRGFKSNSRSVLVGLGVETGSGACDAVNLQLEENDTERVLGMCWNTADDAFQFQTSFSKVKTDIMRGQRTPTKREMLSVSMSLFDPYGLLSEFVLESKLILQDLWRIGVDWDAPVPERIAQRWEQWRQEIERTKLMSIPRCYSLFFTSSSNVQLHIYADASESAFAAVAFWRVAHSEGVDVSFVLARTRCAPLQILTIPRLELQAAVLASRLLTEIRNCHPEIKIAQTVMWTDSATVLSWLRSDQRKYKPFVQIRVSEILEAAPLSYWRWVPTSMNVADDATRVRRPVTFRPESRFIRGPEWLRLNEKEWPKDSPAGEHTDVVDDDVEVRRNFVGAVRESRPIFDYDRYSNLLRILRVTAHVRRYTETLRMKPAERSARALDVDDIEAALMLHCKLAQEEVYGRELAALRREEAVGERSELHRLKVYLAADGLIRVYGRTDEADDQHQPFDSRRPIVLPPQHRFTRLIMHDQHEKHAHQLANATIAEVRRRFWVPRARTLLRSVQAKCAVCKLRNAMPIPPVQGQLPADRLTPYTRPFTSTGLDYFGPVHVTIGRRREKRWVAVFTCLATRATHLEIATDLSTDACLVCVRNLCHVRGTPSRIRCDNGTNFVGARNVLAKEEGFLDAAVMQRELCTTGIQWVMNCPGNPEAGGVWERIVQGVKRILNVTLKDEAPQVETLRAHLIEAANMLNSRPLTHLPISPDDQEALTPNHFLIGGPNAVTMTDPDQAELPSTRKQWRIVRELSRRFWRQWLAEYLPELTRRSRNHPERRELSVNDVVIVCDSSQPRGRWPIGRVVSVVTGKDGRVRTAVIKTKDGEHRRPVARLALLEAEPASNGTRQAGSGVSTTAPS